MDSLPEVTSRRCAPFVAAPALVTLLLCLIRIGARQPWKDEFATWLAASAPFDALGRLLATTDAVLAPYYVLMHFFLRLAGDSETALRLPSALGMALCAGLVADLGARLFRPRIGLWAGLFFAVVPSISRFGQEARPYGLVLAASTFAVWALVRALEAPRERPRWALYAASLVLVGALQLVALSSLMAHPLVLFRREPTPGEGTRVRLRVPEAACWLSAVASALALLSPLIWFGVQQRGQISWTQHKVAHLTQLPHGLFHGPGLGYAVVGLALFALGQLSSSRLLVAAWAWLPTLALWASHARLHLFIHRYLLFTLPAFCLGAALALDDLAARLRSARWFRSEALLPAAFFALLIALGARAHLKLRAPRGPNTPDYRALSASLSARRAHADGIAYRVGGVWDRAAIEYHLRRQSVPRDVFATRARFETGGFAPEECVDASTCPLGDVSRIWLVTSAGRHGDDIARALGPDRASMLRAEFELAESASFPLVTLSLFVRRRE